MSESTPTTDLAPELSLGSVTRLAVPRTQPASYGVVEQAVTTPSRNPALVYLASVSEGSRRSLRKALETTAQIVSSGLLDAEVFPWHRLTYADVVGLREALHRTISERTGKPLGAATINRTLVAVRGVLRAAWRLGLISHEAYQRAADVPSVRVSELLAGRALERHELVALFGACQADRTARGARDAAALALAYGLGLRRSEIAALDLESLDLEHETLRVVGKGRKVAELPVKGGVRDALRAWLRHRSHTPGALVCPVDKAGRVQLRRLSDVAVFKLLPRRQRQAGLATMSPHDLRRSFVSDLLDQGADLSVASRLARHEDPATTKRYDRRGKRAEEDAASLLVVPYADPGER